MSIRLIAKELYQLHREVEELEARIESAPWPEKDMLRDQLRKKKAAWQRLRHIMDGAKTDPAELFRRKI